ncbi:MAG: THUMP domain-containing class I SAM-dependent RNA methyltransferase [Saccharofermentanales bacterium]
MKIIIPTLFGLESTVKEELLALDIAPENIKTVDGRIDIDAGADDYDLITAKCNIWLRTAERVLIKVGGGRAQTFDELFDLTRTIAWEDYIPSGWAFHVNGHSLKSKLFGITACQSIIKKSIVTRLSSARKIAAGFNLPEDERKGLLKMSFSIINDEVSFMFDTSGEGLHKRGYRPLSHTAPLKETLAAALVLLSRWYPDSDEALLDPMCGTGTIPIEAALIATGTAPGINREFSAERWPFVARKVFDTVREEALDKRKTFAAGHPFIFGSDIDAKNIVIAAENAIKAGVSEITSFSKGDVTNLTCEAIRNKTGFARNLIITNPPYGERMLDSEQAKQLFGAMGSLWLAGGKVREGLRLSIIAPREGFEADFGGIADKRRKLYNGMIQCNMHHYFRSLHHN